MNFNILPHLRIGYLRDRIHNSGLLAPLFVDYSLKTLHYKTVTMLKIIGVGAEHMETQPRLNKVFGEQLRSVRKAANLTQEELAFRAMLDRTYISLLERGLKSPTLITFFQLCRVLHQKPGIFISRIEEQLERLEQEKPED